MNDWINLTALGQIVGVGLLCGAGLPALFALGLRLMSPRPAALVPDGPAVATTQPALRTRVGPVGVSGAALCFAVVLAAIGWGIYFIVAGS
jgi:hypothetical protein